MLLNRRRRLKEIYCSVFSLQNIPHYCINSPYSIENVIRNLINVSANDVKNNAVATSAAPKNETCRNVNRLKTGPLARPMRHVAAWFMLIIVVISGD